ncbi:hypothetical protein Bbelb_108670 [Branchiostoma belcheri]|nr:hypothetical protein Bbelb_108670 [Branchiostoma belcheri]
MAVRTGRFHGPFVTGPMDQPCSRDGFVRNHRSVDRSPPQLQLGLRPVQPCSRDNFVRNHRSGSPSSAPTVCQSQPLASTRPSYGGTEFGIALYVAGRLSESTLQAERTDPFNREHPGTVLSETTGQPHRSPPQLGLGLRPARGTFVTMSGPDLQADRLSESALSLHQAFLQGYGS